MKTVDEMQAVLPTSVSDLTKPLQRGGLRSQVSQRLAIAIFAHHFQPGEKLTVQPLAEQFGVSRTPVREALMELESLGMVDVLPHKGVRVREFGPQEARELCHVRKILEREAIRCACGNIPREQLESLQQDLMQVIAAPPSMASSKATREIDARLHATIAFYCQNRRLKEEITRYSTIYKALSDAYYIVLQTSERYVRTEENLEHLAIVNALLSEDPEASQQALGIHLDTWLDDYIAERFTETNVG
ncbi:GntR family transcriptional regulator [Blastopirellula sp. J2-11]|uniref:GntR family transcriptional regulator n=1 Tax=Blastopirellula sp. J2-11 TaxID=2943192 RepID=UPI0021C74C20|nr:GntR family transcriptional regulator [Blastopirellula sp. J2-11]UUO08537.1 GntR family transcriptional regulator [Blastopirellula sp. J2-11]